ncbi:MAG: mechanosensitive ion channel family protein [Planctomycetes bacterium]|nr:mechanosensitive ion channel family protein [Planctomycetota bacterium]
MLNQIGHILSSGAWWGYAARIAGFYLLAWLIHLSAKPIAGRFARLSHLTSQGRRPRPERIATLHSLIASTISILALAGATFFTLGQFVSLTTLVWVVGLFSAAFGLGARPIISDFLTGASFIFEDTFDQGEKVEIVGIVNVEGVIERVSLRATWLRGPTGELFVVPNGEVRIVRNFSRGLFSTADIRLKIAAEDLERTLQLLEKLGPEAVLLLPNLLEPWRVISESGAIGQQTELTLLARARFGKAAEMRPRLLALVQQRLAEAEINLLD